MKKAPKRPSDPADLRRRAEERLKSQPKTAPDVAAAANDQRLIHELQVYQIELELQNEELRESRAEAEEGRARFTELYDFAPVGYVTLTLDGTIVESNLTSASLLGCERAKLRGTRLGSYVERADRPVVSDFLQRVFANPAKSTCEARLSSSDQPARIIQIDATLSRTAQECHAVLIDITEQRKSEATLRESELNFRRMIDLSMVGTMFWDREGLIFDSNDAFLKIVGFDHDDLLAGRIRWREITPPEYHELDLQAFDEVAVAGASEHYEKEYLRKDGSRVPVIVARARLNGDRGVAFVLDVTESRLAESRLKEREQQLRLFVEYSPVAIAMFDRNMRYLVHSRRWLTDFGLGEHVLDGRSHYDIFPDLPERWKAVHRKCLNGAIELCEEDSFVRPDGNIEWLRWEVLPWQTAQGDVGGLIIFSEVITARKRAEEQLRLSEARFRRIVESDLMGMLFWTDTGEVTEANEAFLRIVGYSRQDLLAGRINWRELTPPEYSKLDDHALLGIAVTGVCKPFEKEYLLRNGSRVPVLIGGTAFPEQPGQGVAFVLDISERKRAEAALVSSEQHFRVLFEQATDGILVCDSQLDFVDVNEVGCRMLGYTRDELLTMNALAILVPEEHANVAPEVERLADGNVLQSEWRMLRKDGTEFLGEVTAKRLPDGRFQAFVRDITLRRQAEEMIRASEERFATIFHSSPVGVCISTLKDGVFLDVNEAFLAILGRQRDDVIGRSSLDMDYWVDPNDRQKLVEEMAVKEQGSVRNQEVRFRRKDGRIGDSLRSLEQIKIAGQDCILTVLNDVTEYKQLEELLRRSQSQYKVLLDGAIEAIVLQQDWTIQFANPAAARIFGFHDPQEMVGLNTLETFVAPEDRPRILKRYESLLLGDDIPILSGWKALRQDGTMVYVQSCGARILWDGRPAVLGFYMDVTEQHQLEQSLRESEERIRMVVQASNVGLWDWNLITNDVYFSPEWKRQLGYADDEIPSRYEEWESRLHPDDRAGTLSAVNGFREGHRGNYDVEFRLMHRDGSWRWILTRADLIRDADGKPTRMMGCHVDITDRKRVSEALVERERELRTILDNLLVFVGIFTTDGVLVEANRLPLEMANLRREDVIGQPFAETYWWRYSPEVQERLRSALRRTAAGEIVRYDEVVRSADGFVTIDVCFAPLRDAQGTIVKLVGSAVDITERKRMEDALRDSEAALVEAQVQSKTGSWDLDLETQTGRWSHSMFQLFYRDPAAGLPTFAEFLTFVHPDDVPDFLKLHNGMIETGQPAADVFRTNPDLGPVRHVAFTEKSVVDPQGRAIRLVGTVQDVTVQKNAEHQKQQHLLELARVARLSVAGEMASGIAHELNQPLTAIINFADACHEGVQAKTLNVDRQLQLITKVMEQAHRAGEIIRRLRSLVKPSHSKRSSVDLRELIEQTLPFLEIDSIQYDVHLKIDFPDTLPLVIGDSILIQQVVLNLIRNAIEVQQTQVDAPKQVRVEVSVKENDFVEIVVSDNGSAEGIEDPEQLFEPFFTTKPNGMGLGLPISRSIAESHQGTLTAKRRPTRGLAFHLLLPAQGAGE